MIMNQKIESEKTSTTIRANVLIYAPQILIPMNLSESNTPILVLDLGSLSITSQEEEDKQKQIEMHAHNKNEKCDLKNDSLVNYFNVNLDVCVSKLKKDFSFLISFCFFFF